MYLTPIFNYTAKGPIREILMKISKKDLRRLIMENVSILLEDDETPVDDEGNDIPNETPVDDEGEASPIKTSELSFSGETGSHSLKAKGVSWQSDLRDGEGLGDISSSSEDEIVQDSGVSYFMITNGRTERPIEIELSNSSKIFVKKIVIFEDQIELTNMDDQTSMHEYSEISNLPTLVDLIRRQASQDELSSARASSTSSTGTSDEQPRTRTSIPVNDKVRKIQQIIGAPSSNGGEQLGDGQWGRKTTAAWKAWVTNPDTIAIMKDLKAPRSQNESFSRADLRNLFESIMSENGLLNEDDDASDDFAEYIKANAGDASKIADYVGFGTKLTGVHALATAVADKQNQDTPAQTRQDEDEDTSEVSNEDPGADENLSLSDLKLSIERFKSRGGIRQTGDRNFTEVILNSPPLAIIQGGRSSTKNKLKNYRNLRFRDEGNKKYIVISPKPLRGSLKRYKLGPVKIEGDYVVLDRETNESLSHGALIRRRYRRY